MEPRFILKTHTEALRPGNYSILISRCTYPDAASLRDTVTSRLKEWLERKSVGEAVTLRLEERLRRKSAARFTILTAGQQNRGFGFLLDNMVWSWKGHVINAVLTDLSKATQAQNVDSFFELTKLERIAYLRYFLETEGAIIVKIACLAGEQGHISYRYLAHRIHEIFQEICEDYVALAGNPRDQARIRGILRQMREQIKSKEGTYDQDTVPHKVKPHLQALEDLGIVRIKTQDAEQLYEGVPSKGTSRLSLLYRELPDVRELERVVSDYNYFQVVARVLDLEPVKYDEGVHRELLRQTLYDGYSVMKNRVTGLADIDALLDWCSIKMLSDCSILVHKNDGRAFLESMRREDPSSIRYHVDRQGRIAYLIIPHLANN